MRRFTLLAAAALVVPLLAAVATAPGAQADPRPGIGESWPHCGVAPDDDNRFCIVSATADGVAAPLLPAGSGHSEIPYVDLIGSGVVRYGIDVWDDGVYNNTDGSNPDTVWQITARTGPIHPRELYGIIRDPSFIVSGSDAAGWQFTITFKPAPVAWRDFALECGPAACGDDTTVADLVYDGFVTGYVTDLEDADLEVPYTPAQREHRTGTINAYNANSVGYYYDAETNAIVVEMANPHLKAPGVPATGYFETFLPNDLLTYEMGVPYPGSLTGGSLRVTRNGGASSVPITLTHEPGGVRIEIADITFSTPTYRIKPKPSSPGAPRRVRVTRTDAHHAKVSYRVPIADGGADITGYTARCRKGTKPWHTERVRRGPVVVGGLPAGKVTCQVRATNKVGAGRWSPTASS